MVKEKCPLENIDRSLSAIKWKLRGLSGGLFMVDAIYAGEIISFES